MPSLISHLAKTDQQALLDDLNYLNMGEIKAFCKRHAIPCSICVETTEGTMRKTSEGDRKGIVLKRIRHYLTTGTVLEPTCFPSRVVCHEKLPRVLKETDQLFYGQYDKKNRALLALLAKLTDGEFRDGAVARILMNELWRKGVAPTYRDFAAAWSDAQENHTRPNAEWAFLSDRAEGKDTSDWKQLRTSKAKRVLQTLNGIAPNRTTGTS